MVLIICHVQFRREEQWMSGMLLSSLWIYSSAGLNAVQLLHYHLSLLFPLFSLNFIISLSSCEKEVFEFQS